MDKAIFVMDSRMKKFIEGSVLNNVIMVRLKDINESFAFDDKTEAQEFITTQCQERFGENSLKDGFFDYIEETNKEIIVHRYHVEELKNGKILQYREEVMSTRRAL